MQIGILLLNIKYHRNLFSKDDHAYNLMIFNMLKINDPVEFFRLLGQDIDLTNPEPSQAFLWECLQLHHQKPSLQQLR